ncbi:MAG: RNase J family beta-CASP ribonuclease [Euryarchaeota archaeon]|nr:RNase J family beta-CASP ribonuclease [Euryarchaeota archaeon]MBU4491893.1 RNase J family beta-CASP ribonuclease [Euryarchaeota archaeon]MCG2727528.1 RNase J family beta-CASP ribonuclease [Candidatus Methanoperedenaceae archaeon]
MTEIGIIAVGGYNEMGRNMTGIRIDNEIIVLDMGLQLDRVQIHEDVEIDKMHSMDLIKIGAIPDDTIMKEVSGSVKAIVCTHGHLDHIGAIPKLAHRYKAPIIATTYTAELVRHEISEEKKFKVNNEVIPLKLGGRYNLTPDIQIEFIRIQHSIVDSAFAAIHTPGGIILYASDFKLDRTPTLGEPPDFQRLRKLGKEGVRVMITESTNSGLSGKTPSEKIAEDLVRDVLLGTEETDSGVLITTFSSHVARINAIIEAAEEMNRIPVLLGRSMERYLSIAQKMGYIKFPEALEIHGNRNAVEKALKRISQDGKKKYLPIVTGHQGEPDSILTRIANLETQFKIEPGDKVIFSANKIPSPMTMANRHAIEIKLKMQGARIYENVHVSGHASREDHWELLRLIAPEQVIPSHGNMAMHSNYVEMAEDAGYVFGDTVHIMRNGEEMVL